jgi:ribosome biogenesis GTPase
LECADIEVHCDSAVVLMGLDHDFNPRRMERYLALVHAAGVAPVVGLIKADIVIDAPARWNRCSAASPRKCRCLRSRAVHVAVDWLRNMMVRR